MSSSGKLDALRDAHNVRMQPETENDDTDEWTATVDELERFQQHDANSFVDVLVRDGTDELEMMMLQTGHMRENVRLYPEFVQLDSTYAQNQARLPIYALIVEDANGIARVGALILACGESAVSIQTMLACIREHNPDLDRTRVVIVDRLFFAEAQAVKEVLPHAEIQLSVFSVLKAMKKELVRCVPHAVQRQVYGIVQNLVYAWSPSVFADEWSQLDDYPEFAAYMASTWLPIKSWWVHFERVCRINLGRSINSRIGSPFGRIRKVVGEKRRLNDCVRHLIAVVNSLDVQGQYQSFSDTYKTTYRNCVASAADGYFDICTPYAAKQIIDELQLADSDLYTIEGGNDAVKSESGLVTVTTVEFCEQFAVTESASRCSCGFNWAMSLPCRHILLVRKEFGLPMVDANIVAGRWKRSRLSVQLMPISVPSSPFANGLGTSRPMSKSEKYSAASKLINRLCVVMSEVGGMRQFESMSGFVSKVIERFEAGKECVLLKDEVRGEPVQTVVDITGSENVAEGGTLSEDAAVHGHPKWKASAKAKCANVKNVDKAAEEEIYESSFQEEPDITMVLECDSD